MVARGIRQNVEEETVSEFERVFNLENISGEIATTKRLVEGRFSDKISIISALIEAQTNLTGIYVNQIFVKLHSRLKYDDNILLNNTLLNFPYRSLSTLLLIRNTFYGSARVVCRQLFESSIIAKYSEYDPLLTRKWASQDDETARPDPLTEVSLYHDVFKKLRQAGKNISALSRTWKDLCNFTHATMFSQQRLRILYAKKGKGVNTALQRTGFFEHTEYTLDLLLTLLAMNFHLILGYYCRKANRWWFGYLRDPFGSYEREKSLKADCRKLTKEYFDLDQGAQERTKLWKRNISEFKQSWGLGTMLTAKIEP
jgi:hypothetical protein